MSNKFSVMVWLGLAALAGCGGGGGGASTPAIPTPLAVEGSSYANKNSIALDLPQLKSVASSSIAESVTFGDFFQNGTYSAFVAVAQAGAAPAKAYFFKKNASGGWDDATASLLTSTEVCATVTQAITADLNGDGKPDVYVACRGSAAIKQVIFMSQRNASTYVRQETTFTLQSWGAAAGDIDGDGFIDIVATDNDSTVALMNDGLGTLTKDTNRVPVAGAGLPTLHRKVFLLPRTGARPDLVIAGSGAGLNSTTIFMKNSAGYFYLNQSSLFESKVLNGTTTAKVYDVIETDSYLYALAKYVPVENASAATEVLLLRYELPKNNVANSDLNLCANSNNTCIPTSGSGNALTLPSNPYAPSDGFVSQLKRNSAGSFVAYDGACTLVQGDANYTNSRCGFSVVGP